MPTRTRIVRKVQQLAALTVLLGTTTACITSGGCEGDQTPELAICDRPDSAESVSVESFELVNPRGRIGLQGSSMLLFDVQVLGSAPPSCAGVDYEVRSPETGALITSGHVDLEMEPAPGGTANVESYWMFWEFGSEVDLEVTAYGHTQSARVCRRACDEPDGGAPDAGM